MGLCTYMRPYFLKQMLAAVGAFGLLADGAVAAPQAAIDKRAVAQTNAAIAVSVAASTPQTYGPIGGTFTGTVLNSVQRPGYFNGNYATAWGGSMGLSPLGGTFYPGAIGGTMNGPIPPGGRMPNVIVAGAAPPGGFLSGRPPGGQFGANVLGGISGPSNAVTGRSSGVIIAGGTQPGGTQTAGASPGGVIIAGTAPGGRQTAGASPGGVIIAGTAPGGRQTAGASPGGVIIAGGSAPNTNAPGGQPH
jgi:hypothetical protein